MSSCRLSNLLGVVTVSDISIWDISCEISLLFFLHRGRGNCPWRSLFFFLTDKLHKILFDWCAADSLQCTSSNSGSIFLSESRKMPWENGTGCWNLVLQPLLAAWADLPPSCLSYLGAVPSFWQACSHRHRLALKSVLMRGIHVDPTVMHQNTPVNLSSGDGCKYFRRLELRYWPRRIILLD